MGFEGLGVDIGELGSRVGLLSPFRVSLGSGRIHSARKCREHRLRRSAFHCDAVGAWNRRAAVPLVSWTSVGTWLVIPQETQKCLKQTGLRTGIRLGVKGNDSALRGILRLEQDRVLLSAKVTAGQPGWRPLPAVRYIATWRIVPPPGHRLQ